MGKEKMERREFLETMLKSTGVLVAGGVTKFCSSGTDTPTPTPTPTPTDPTYSNVKVILKDIFTSQEVSGNYKIKDTKGNISGELSSGGSLDIVSGISDIDVFPTNGSHIKGYVVLRTGDLNQSGELAHYKDVNGSHITAHDGAALASLSNDQTLYAYMIPKSFANEINFISKESSLLTLAKCIGDFGASGEKGNGVVERYNNLQDPNTTTVNSNGEVLFSLNTEKSVFIKSRDSDEAKVIEEYLTPDGYPLFHKNTYTGKMKFFFNENKSKEILGQAHSSLKDYMSNEGNVILNPKTGKTFGDGLENTILASKGFLPDGYSSANATNSKVQVIKSGIYEVRTLSAFGKTHLEDTRNAMNNANLGVFVQPPSDVDTYLADGLTMTVDNGTGVYLAVENNVVNSSRVLYNNNDSRPDSHREEMFSGVTSIWGDINRANPFLNYFIKGSPLTSDASKASRLTQALPVGYKLSVDSIPDDNIIN